MALVTGAGQRVGARLCKRLAESGYAVVIHYRSNAEGAEALREHIVAHGGRAATVQADLADRIERSGLMSRAAQQFGPITVLVNNASIFSADSAGDLDEGLWDAHFAVHVEAPSFLGRDFAAQLPDGCVGNIVNMIDERVLHPAPAYFSYSLSKSALHTATTLLAQTFAPRIRVNAIGPGPVLPHTGQSEDAFAAGVEKLPLKTHAGPDEIADALMFLLSAQSMTGQMLALDGGSHIDYLPRRGPTPRQ
ncbi:short chain dehydrogenase [Devosia pacifica]|uniref:Short chain dehydrogenase n=1 Tax=Devosia pacifica TaxID=1335967 RepID=A0A918S1Y8_9HYPH|nr:short chain dehydrogenase [Devosia pacifica]